MVSWCLKEKLFLVISLLNKMRKCVIVKKLLSLLFKKFSNEAR